MWQRSLNPARSGSDELLRGEELGQRGGAGPVLVGDDLAGGPRRPGAGLRDLAPRHRQADLVGAAAEWTEVAETTERPPRTAGEIVTDEDGSGAKALVDFLVSKKFV